MAQTQKTVALKKGQIYKDLHTARRGRRVEVVALTTDATGTRLAKIKTVRTANGRKGTRVSTVKASRLSVGYRYSLVEQPKVVAKTQLAA